MISCQAYQQLCDLRHGMGLAVLSMWASFFGDGNTASITKEANQLLDWPRYLYSNSTTTLEADQLLKWYRYLYSDLDYSNAGKVFKSCFIVHLLASTYIPQIKGWIHVHLLNCPMLHHSGLKGNLGLCGAAVWAFSCYLTMSFSSIWLTHAFIASAQALSDG